jgi:hypothetical protein
MKLPRLLWPAAAVALLAVAWAGITQWPARPISGGDIDLASPFNQDALGRFHMQQVNAFGQSIGFGMPRVTQPTMWEPALLSAQLELNGHRPANFQRTQFKLVSVLLHSPPVAYVSIPRGEGRHNSYAVKMATPAASRPIDPFEAAALARLQDGENLVVKHFGNELRLFGAVRAQASCLSCHEAASEGTLLGAFSYSLIPPQAE